MEVLFFFGHTELEQNAVFPNFAGQIALTQYSGRSKHALPSTKNYRIDHVIKRFHKESSIMSGLFGQNNLLLCGILHNNDL